MPLTTTLTLNKKSTLPKQQTLKQQHTHIQPLTTTQTPSTQPQKTNKYAHKPKKQTPTHAKPTNNTTNEYNTYAHTTYHYATHKSSHAHNKDTNTLRLRNTRCFAYRDTAHQQTPSPSTLSKLSCRHRLLIYILRSPRGAKRKKKQISRA